MEPLAARRAIRCARKLALSERALADLDRWLESGLGPAVPAASEARSDVSLRTSTGRVERR